MSVEPVGSGRMIVESASMDITMNSRCYGDAVL